MAFINLPETGASNYKAPVATSGDLPATGNSAGDMRVLTDTNQIVVWDAGSSAWVVTGGGGGGGGFVERFTLDAGDLAAKNVTLGTSPTDPGSIQFVVIGGPDQNKDVDFSLSGTTVSWNGLALDGILEIGDQLIISYS